jgi:predicted TIM-barrel fold metal-dependent hydrolase
MSLDTEARTAGLSAAVMISADSHVVEDPALWDGVLPDGHWGELTRSFSQKGAYDAEARVPEMAVDGVSAEVLYPSLAMKLFALEPDVQAECFRRYNEWIAQFCAVAPDRLIGVGLVPVYDMDRALEEVRWCDEHGLRGVQIWQSPHPDLPFTGDHYDRFWADCAARGLPVSLHAITGFDHSQRLFGDMAKGDVSSSIEFFRINNHCLFAVMDTLLDLVFSGALDRNPDLQVVLVENEVAWLPFALDTWDYFFDKFGEDKDIGLERRPSACVRDHVFATFLMDGNVGPVARQIGAGNLMWSNDYPHGMSTWPNSRSLMQERLADLDDAERAALLGGNVARLYDIQVP